MGFKLGVLALVYALVVLLVEAGGRVYLVLGGLPWNSTLATYQNDDVLGYKPNPFFALDDIRFNSMGFRADREYTPFPQARTVRILAAGGSTTYGTGASVEEAYPSQLEHHLQEMGQASEVVNAGVSGWQIHQIRHSLPHWLEGVHPHVVLISSCWNTGLKPYKYYRNENFITYPLFQYSLLFRLLDRRLRNVGLSLHYHPFLHTREEARLEQEAINADPGVFDLYEAHVRAVVNLCREAGSEPVFVIPPGNLPDRPDVDPVAYFRGTSFAEKAPNYELMCIAVNRTRDLSAERIFRVREAESFSIIDARELFDALEPAARQALFYDELHLNAEGNRQLAGFIAGNLAATLTSPRLSLLR